MRTVVLAGGRGARLGAATAVRPKPMVAVGGKPILWHICRWYARHGFTEFLVAAGYLAEQIREGFPPLADPAWAVEIVDTGVDTHTGGRLRRLADRLADTFAVTYGDGLGNVDLTACLAFHRAHGRLATVTAVRPPSRFGALALEGDRVARFDEKPRGGEGWINGGFFVFEPGVLGYIADDGTPLEAEPLTRLAADGQLMAWRHEGFWHPMDTERDREHLEALWASGAPPWEQPR